MMHLQPHQTWEIWGGYSSPKQEDRGNLALREKKIYVSKMQIHEIRSSNSVTETH